VLIISDCNDEEIVKIGQQ